MQVSLPCLLRRLPLLASLPLACLLLLPTGCAKSPDGVPSNSSSGPQVFVTMTVAGNLNPNYYYFVLFNVNEAKGPGTGITGPVPVVAAPYGNGFAAGAFTNYIEYHNGQPGGTNFGFWTISSDLLTPSYLGSSSPYLVQSRAGSSTITMQIPLAALATASTPTAAIQNIEVNFIATNIVPPPGDTLTAKYVDSLYPTNDPNSLNRFIIIPTTQSGIYQNSDQNLEPSGDVTQYVNGFPITVTPGQLPDVGSLDITDWSVRVSS